MCRSARWSFCLTCARGFERVTVSRPVGLRVRRSRLFVWASGFRKMPRLSCSRPPTTRWRTFPLTCTKRAASEGVEPVAFPPNDDNSSSRLACRRGGHGRPACRLALVDLRRNLITFSLAPSRVARKLGRGYLVMTTDEAAAALAAASRPYTAALRRAAARCPF